jgi:hypothetical protein
LDGLADGESKAMTRFLLFLGVEKLILFDYDYERYCCSV